MTVATGVLQGLLSPGSVPRKVVVGSGKAKALITRLARSEFQGVRLQYRYENLPLEGDYGHEDRGVSEHFEVAVFQGSDCI